MRTFGNAIGAILVAVGGIWWGQGAGYIRGSFMTADSRWLVTGAVVVVVGVALLIWTNSRDPAA